MPICGKVFYGINGVDKITNTNYDYIPKNGQGFIIKIIFDMTDIKCRLKYEIDNKGIEVTFDGRYGAINAHNKYRLGIAMHEQQKVEILTHD